MSEQNLQYRIPEDADVSGIISRAKLAFYRDPNVIGVGVGHRRVGGETHHDELSLIVYVKEKGTPDAVNPEYRIPPEFEGMATDVVEAFHPGAPEQALGFSDSHQHSDDMSYVDWPRLHSQWSTEAGGAATVDATVQDIGNICVIEDDGTLVQTVNGQQVVDFVRAYQLFRTTHPDDFDFVTFFTDSASGMPPQGGSSWYRFVFNDADGIGFGPFDERAAYGSSKLQGIMFLNQGHFNVWRYVMLQEQGHRWTSFARYRDTQGGPIQTDHLLGGWGHWELNFDDDRSPMDYDIFDWVASGSNFMRVALTSNQRAYCDLDLYLMGLLAAGDVAPFQLLSNVTLISGDEYSADPKQLTVDNVVMAEGQRSPSVTSSQKSFKNAFVLLTKSSDASNSLVTTVDGLRQQFESDFADGTRHLAEVGTSLGQGPGDDDDGPRRWW